MSEESTAVVSPKKDEPAAFDVRSLISDLEATAELHVLSKERKPTGFYITLYSKDSERAEEIADKYTNRRFRHLSKRTGLQLTAQEVRDQTMDTLVALTHSWRATKWRNDEPYPFTEGNVRGLYNEPHIQEQVAEFVEDRSNFTKR